MRTLTHRRKMHAYSTDCVSIHLWHLTPYPAARNGRGASGDGRKWLAATCPVAPACVRQHYSVRKEQTLCLWWQHPIDRSIHSTKGIASSPGWNIQLELIHLCKNNRKRVLEDLIAKLAQLPNAGSI